MAYEDIADLAGGGLRDTTRVAAGDPKLWTEILLENADALQRSMGECITELAKVQEMLRTQDHRLAVCSRPSEEPPSSGGSVASCAAPFPSMK